VRSFIVFEKQCSYALPLADDDNTLVTEGPHSRVFQDRIGKTHYMGRPMPAGNVWQAKGDWNLLLYRACLMQCRGHPAIHYQEGSGGSPTVPKRPSWSP